MDDIHTLDTHCKLYVIHILAIMKGNVTHTAEALDLDRRTLRRMMVRWNIPRVPFNPVTKIKTASIYGVINSCKGPNTSPSATLAGSADVLPSSTEHDQNELSTTT